MVNRQAAATLLAAVLVLAAGCATPSPPVPALPDGAPRDLRAAVAEPCRLLTEEQAEQLDLAEAEVQDSGINLTCYWQLGDEGTAIQIGAEALVDQAAPLANLPRIADPPGAVESTTVAGLPALLAPRSRLPGSRCELGVRSGPGQSLELSLFDSSPEVEPGCDVVRRAAERMLANPPPPA